MISIKLALKTIWHTCDATNLILNTNCSILATHEVWIEKKSQRKGYHKTFCDIETTDSRNRIGRYCEACGKAYTEQLRKEQSDRNFDLIKIPNIDQILALLKN